MKRKDMEILNLKSQTHAQTLQKEAQETAEMHTAIKTITSQRDSRATKRERLKQQIAETQKAINSKLEAQRAYASTIDSQALLNGPELDFWHDHLCLRIEGAGVPDHLKFTYTHINDQDWGREAWFELSMASREYDVLHCRPKLEKEALAKVVDGFNEERDLGAFLKQMRRLFVEAMK